jgi:CHASE3 domain sensor protein
MEMLTDAIMPFWNAILTILIAIVGFIMKEKFHELDRLSILLNKTREEVARDTVTQAELSKIMDHIDIRFNRLEDKINELIRGSNAKS